MVLNNSLESSIGQSVLDGFDIVENMGFSSDGSSESASSNILTDEFLRKALSTKSKDTTQLTYEFDAALGLTEGNGNTIQKIGLFETLSGDDLKLSKVLTEAIAKTTDREINVGYQITIQVIDETA